MSTVRSAKDRDAERAAQAVPNTSSTSHSETRQRSSASTATAQPPQGRSNNARALFDPSATDRQRRNTRDAPLGHAELPPPRGNERTRSPALRYAHESAAAPQRSPLRAQAKRAGTARRGGYGDDDDEDDFVRDDNKYLVKPSGGAGAGEEEDPRDRRHLDSQCGYDDRRNDEYSRTQARHAGGKEPKRTRFRDFDDGEYDSDAQDDHRHHMRDRRRSSGQAMESQTSSKYAPITANERTSSGEGLHSWGRRQEGDEHDGTKSHSSAAHGGGAGVGGRYQGQGPMRMLFNPNVHDPLKFQQAPSVSTGSGSNATSYALSTGGNDYPYRHGGSSSIGTTISAESHADRSRGGKRPPSRLSIPMMVDEDDEEEQKRGDRERERRKRKEGSERGLYAKKRGEEDGKSKGSRSSEGSESLKDRERGRGK
ncbi:hypothetical protein QFC22_003188 [Naganishia vaughanmartiniae]|uniref:Uncharacterized protein n=1 Tax=Naganishia vaughanmartiniae TaxID=1424756 RepID=A0ACC2X9J2_9TREE|nr:hypothetical protein QFC22_003188 [Naganishia vaughanmartiniae]